jgi:hypothetical protein
MLHNPGYCFQGNISGMNIGGFYSRWVRLLKMHVVEKCGVSGAHTLLPLSNDMINLCRRKDLCTEPFLTYC